jgi:hypothetical protein
LSRSPNHLGGRVQGQGVRQDRCTCHQIRAHVSMAASISQKGRRKFRTALLPHSARQNHCLTAYGFEILQVLQPSTSQLCRRQARARPLLASMLTSASRTTCTAPLAGRVARPRPRQSFVAAAASGKRDAQGRQAANVIGTAGKLSGALALALLLVRQRTCAA